LQEAFFATKLPYRVTPALPGGAGVASVATAEHLSFRKNHPYRVIARLPKQSQNKFQGMGDMLWANVFVTAFTEAALG
jgi:hypothetical protein